jgi:hypothetical protein
MDNAWSPPQGRVTYVSMRHEMRAANFLAMIKLAAVKL